MKLAVNFSEILMNLLAKDKNLPVDMIKVPTIPFPECSEQFERGSWLRRLLPHLAQPGILSLGQPHPEKRFNLDLLRRICHDTSPPYLSTHLEVKVDFFPEFSSKQHENDKMLKETVVAHFVAAISQLKEYLEIPVVLENFPYYTWWVHFRMGSDPEFIGEICERGDCGFLLDIAHARCSAWHMGLEPMDYIRMLPLNRLKEIHLSGVRLRPEEGLRDCHTAPEEEDYRILETVLNQTTPEIVTIEYGGLPDRIMNIRQEYEGLSRNDPEVLAKIIEKTRSLL